MPYRGKRNEPAYVLEVARKVAELRGVSLEHVIEQTGENARRLFSLPA
jgi:TatD DNase family protein